MAQDFSQYSAGNDFTGFNYNNEADKIKRQRALADQLAATTQQPDKGSFVQNNMGTFYAGANSAVTGVAKVLGALLAGKDYQNADQSTSNLDTTSAAALANQLAHINEGHSSTTTTDDYSPSKDSQAANQIEANANDTGARTFPVEPQHEIVSTPLPPPPQAPVPAELASQLQRPPQAAMAPAVAAGAPQGGPVAVPPVAQQAPVPNLQAPPPRDMPPGTVLQPAPGGQPPMEPPPVAPPPEPAAVIAAASPGTRTTTTTNTPPSDAEMISRYAALAQTGPMGAQIAQAQLNNMLGSKNGRFTTEVKNDPVNGGFIKVITDTRTGATNVEPINVGGGKTLITGQTTNERGERLNLHKDGSTSPVLDSNGKPVVDAAVVKSNNEATQKVAQAVSTNKAAQASIDSALAMLDRIDELGGQTFTGPIIGGKLPNWTKSRQELSSLMARDVFAETRDAVSAAGDAGGAPRMAQSEFQFMKDKGGLSMDQDPEVRHNLIAQQKIRLLALKQSLGQYGGTLGGVADASPVTPSGAPPSAQPSAPSLDWKR